MRLKNDDVSQSELSCWDATMSPTHCTCAPWAEAFRKGFNAACKMAPAMTALVGVMLFIVVLYYTWGPWNAILSGYAIWQHSLGIVGAATVAGMAGGVLSELSLVYFQHRGRWTLASLENMLFKFGFFGLTGALVYGWYHVQAFCFGDSVSFKVVTYKVLADQFGFSVFITSPVNALGTRWQINRYSFTALRRELDRSFIFERILPILVTGWMFWIPAAAVVYSVPLILQTPMFLIGTSIWGLLLPAVSREGHGEEAEQAALLAGPCALPDSE